MSKYFVSCLVVLLFVAGAQAKEASRHIASTGCSVAQVMRTLHQKADYRKYEYAGNGNPVTKQHENNDQYIFWVDDNGQTCTAIVTYESGSCTNGAAVVKTNDCQ